jgi:type VI protein secretion system component VasF
MFDVRRIMSILPLKVRNALEQQAAQARGAERICTRRDSAAVARDRRRPERQPPAVGLGSTYIVAAVVLIILHPLCIAYDR